MIPCEYSREGKLHKLPATICTLTGRACIIINVLDAHDCSRRLWAIQYQSRHLFDAPEGPRSSTGAQAGMG